MSSNPRVHCTVACSGYANMEQLAFIALINSTYLLLVLWYVLLYSLLLIITDRYHTAENFLSAHRYLSY